MGVIKGVTRSLDNGSSEDRTSVSRFGIARLWRFIVGSSKAARGSGKLR